MKKILSIIGFIVGSILAIITAGKTIERKKNKEIEKLNEEKKEAEIREAVLIERAANAKKKTIESKKELEREIEKINSTDRVHFSSTDDFIKHLRRGRE